MTIPIKTLHKLLRYEPDAGKLFWLERPIDMFNGGYFTADANCRKWNTLYAGKEAFTCVGTDGYKKGSILGKTLRASRVIWAMETGAWPKGEVDHENRIRLDNSFGNLRDVTPTQNQRNRTQSKNNTSGHVGVTWRAERSKWAAQIGVNGKMKQLGLFNCITAAAVVRKLAESKYGFHENHGMVAQ